MQLARTKGLLKSLSGTSEDTFWTLRGREADFLRLRNNGNNVEISVKGIDTDSALDRMEEEFYSTDDVAQVEKVLTFSLGEPNGIITKEHYTYWLKDHMTVLSCYTVLVNRLDCNGDYVPSVTYIEIESEYEEKVLEIEGWLVGQLRDHKIETKRSSGSLHDMFILDTEEK